MRLSLFLVLVVATFAVLATAEKTTSARHLKGTQTDDDLTAEDEERGKFDGLLAKMKDAGMVGEKAATGAAGTAGAANKWESLSKRLGEMKNLKNVDDAAAGATGTANKWESLSKRLGEIKNLKNVDDAAAGATGAATGAAKNWEKLAKAVESGAHVKKVDTTTSKWKTAFAKLKDNPQLKDMTETQAVKITETAAKEVAKNPSKWRYVKKFLEISFGAALTALIVVGFNSMTS